MGVGRLAGVCHMGDRADAGGTVLVASEPLSHDEGWQSVAANTMLLIDNELAIEERPIQINDLIRA